MKTKRLKDDITAAAEIIKTGGLVAVPTETVYGLAANGLDAAAVKKIFELKGRSEKSPLSLMVSGVEAMDALCADVPAAAKTLAEKFWQGPLTIVLKASDKIPEIVRAGGDTVGLRCPKHEKTQELLKACGVPLAAPSANPSGKDSPKTSQQVLDYFDGKIDAVIDGGDCALGVESTVYDMSATPYRVLRAGALPEEEITAALIEGMTVIGITGGTGTGKTTALNVLKDMGGLVIDCDAVYHRLLKESKPMLADIDEAFPGVVRDGAVDTKELGEIVFKDEQKLLMLNLLTHKYVGEEMDKMMSEWAKKGGRVCALDAIALIESGVDSLCDATIGVTAPTEVRIQRLMKRDGITREYAKMRIDAQQSNEFYERNCTYTLSNDGGLEEFQDKSRALFGKIIKG